MLEFSSAVISVKEKKILDELDQERMLKAPDKEAAFSVLFDTDLSEIIQEDKNIEVIIEKDLVRLRDMLKKILQEKEELFFYLFLRFDALNLKAVLKESNLSFPAIETKERIQRKVRGENIELNPYITSMIEDIILKNDSSAEIERGVDKAFFKQKLLLAQKLNKSLVKFVKTEIDVANIKSLIKGNGFIEGGSLKKKELEKLVGHQEGEIEQNLSKFLEIFELSHLLEHKKGEVEIDKALQSFLSDNIFTKEREIGFGMEKILSFFQRKINAHNNIKLILFGKEHNISISEIENNLLPI